MIPTHRSVPIIAFAFGFLLAMVHSLRFEFQSGQTKCISEDMRSNAMTVGKFSIVNPSDALPIDDSHKLNLRVTSPRGNNYHTSELVTGVEAKDWKTGVEAKDWSSIAKKDQLYFMEVELNKLNDIIHQIHEEMFNLREREEEMQDLNKETNSRMAWLSFLSLCICLSVAALHNYGT